MVISKDVTGKSGEEIVRWVNQYEKYTGGLLKGLKHIPMQLQEYKYALLGMYLLQMYFVKTAREPF